MSSLSVVVQAPRTSLSNSHAQQNPRKIAPAFIRKTSNCEAAAFELAVMLRGLELDRLAGC